MPIEKLTSGPFNAISPVAVSRDSLIYIYWTDDRSGDYEIYSMQGVNGLWETEERISNSQISAKYPVAAIDVKGNLYLVWCGWTGDDRKDPDLYFTCNISAPWDLAASDQDIKAPFVKYISCYPNPVCGTASIKYLINSDANTMHDADVVKGAGKVQIYNVTGQLVYSFGNSLTLNEERTMTWNCIDNHGKRVPNGVYLVKLSLNNRRYVNKITVMR
jgi:hypothetical protein